ncbi:unnamed protein product, partial [Effrenium voratum]
MRPKVASLLLEESADPDATLKPGSLFRAVELISRGIMLLRGKNAPGLIRVFGEGSTTPLGYAAL